MTVTEATTPTEEEKKRAYIAALKFVARRVTRPDELVEIARDAATDAVIWSIQKYRSGRGGSFEAFAASAVRRFVLRKVRQSAKRYHAAPIRQQIHEGIPARSSPEGGPIPLPLAVRELPDDLKDTVRFFYVDKFDMRECALLLGCSGETVRNRLHRAARLLSGGESQVDRLRKAGEKRMIH